MGFRGNSTTAQSGAAACSSLEINSGARDCIFEKSTIGHNSYGVARSVVTSGQMLLKYDTADLPNPSNMVFDECLFLSRLANGTAGTDVGVPMVYHSTNVAADRLWLFKNCHFDNWSDNWQCKAAEVFKSSGSVTTSNFRLKNCSASGFTSWTASQHGYGSAGTWWLESDMPITGTGGGLTRSSVGAAGA
jgi:hypothetical protein